MIFDILLAILFTITIIMYLLSNKWSRESDIMMEEIERLMKESKRRLKELQDELGIYHDDSREVRKR